MLLKYQEILRRRRENERGDSEVVSVILLIPISVFLLLAMINLSLYFNFRSQVQDFAREGARLVSLYGGASGSIPLNTYKQSVSQVVYNQMWQGHCTFGGCVKPPKVTCAPDVVGQAGSQVYCEITAYYSPVANDIFGFGAITQIPITIRETFISETGYTH